VKNKNLFVVEEVFTSMETYFKKRLFYNKIPNLGVKQADYAAFRQSLRTSRFMQFKSGEAYKLKLIANIF
jgi:hypothetical protein